MVLRSIAHNINNKRDPSCRQDDNHSCHFEPKASQPDFFVLLCQGQKDKYYFIEISPLHFVTVEME
ncbi:hypothetical protein V1389_06630 [Flavobacterium rakeshii]|uniref:hypothetical protein n=1 Tax=Flavobacterium rakeshii TaxID=1038845 RepID=UPI002E7BE160|nr:hypothetical protein [Flavobacterium rakeshii]MEE1898001.1 hypothetical protein [Flavobacterium rakeshii]